MTTTTGLPEVWWHGLVPDGSGAMVCTALVAAAVVVALPERRRAGDGKPHPSRPVGRPDLGRFARGRRSARPVSAQPPPAAVVADLVAAMLAAGLPTRPALATVRAAAEQAGLAPPTDLGPLVEALALADETGLAPAGLVRAAAIDQRRQLSAARSVAAQRLSILVVLPMGLCLLPAFILLTVAPLVLGLLAG